MSHCCEKQTIPRCKIDIRSKSSNTSKRILITNKGVLNVSSIIITNDEHTNALSLSTPFPLGPGHQPINLCTMWDWSDLSDCGANIEGLGGLTVNVYWPIIVNEKAIGENEEVILQYDKEERLKIKKKRQGPNAFDLLQRREK